MISLYETVLFNNITLSKQFSVQDHCIVLCVCEITAYKILTKKTNGKGLEAVRTVHLADIYKI
jgi:hypothetical protein